MAHNPPRQTWIIALAAALVIALAIGAYVVGKSAGAQPAAQASSTVTATAPAVTKTADPTSTTSTTNPTTSDSPTTSTSTSTSTCNLPAGDQTVPTTTPKVDAVEPYDAAGVPVSNTYGPTQRTGEVWGCFQKSPTGAAFAAAYISLASTNAASWNFYSIGFPKSEKNNVGGNSNNEVIGFKVKAYKPGDALVNLAVKIRANGKIVYVDYPMHLVWVDSTWKATIEGISEDGSGQIISGIEDFIPWKAAS